MQFTAVEKILMKHSVEPMEKLSPGDLITAHIDCAGFHSPKTTCLGI